jgi:hypothetical protein
MGQALLERRCLVPDPWAVSTFDHAWLLALPCKNSLSDELDQTFIHEYSALLNEPSLLPLPRKNSLSDACDWSFIPKGSALLIMPSLQALPCKNSLSDECDWHSVIQSRNGCPLASSFLNKVSYTLFTLPLTK